MLDENGIEKEAQIITVIEVDNKEYVIYSIEKDTDNDNIYVKELFTDNMGNKNIKDIEENNKEKIFNIVKELINEVGSE